MNEGWREKRKATFEQHKDAEWPPKDLAPRDIPAVREELSKRAKNKRAYEKKARFGQQSEKSKAAADPALTPEMSKTWSDVATPALATRSDAPGWPERERALPLLKVEAAKAHDRIFASHGERVRRMRSPNERRGVKTEAGVPLSERVYRINILLRAGVYDRSHLKELPEVVRVKMSRFQVPNDITSGTEEYWIEVKKSDIEDWLFKERKKGGLEEYERQRLYVIGRKKIDFKMRREDYPDKTDEEFEQEVLFQKDQKWLADALEVVAVPMLRGVFKSLGKNVEVYLTSANDDIAGGLDVAIELKKQNGEPHRFFDGTPMRFVVDMTYARMRGKAKIDLARGRISDDAYSILKGKGDEVPPPLSNARAMKLFRSVVETLGSTMSIQTFGKKGPLTKPQEHVPRLIIGLDWASAFTAIADWVEQGDDFEESFEKSDLAGRITQSIGNQLRGLHALASRDDKNPNTEYLAQILRTMDFKVDERRALADDRSLKNIDNLLTLDTEPLNKWQRDRLYRAALAQVEYDKVRGRRVRGDAVEQTPLKRVVEKPTETEMAPDVVEVLKQKKDESTPDIIEAQPSAELSDAEIQERLRTLYKLRELQHRLGIKA